MSLLGIFQDTGDDKRGLQGPNTRVQQSHSLVVRRNPKEYNFSQSGFCKSFGQGFRLRVLQGF